MDLSSNSSTLRRRYSVATPPSELILPKTTSFQPPRTTAVTATKSSSDSSSSSSSPMLSFSFPTSIDFEFTSFNSQSYTSLKDILPSVSAVNSPTTTGPSSASSYAYEIPIRNRLVKQAAWAYLQPMAASPSSSTTPFFHRFVTGDYFRAPIIGCFGFLSCSVIPGLTRAFQQLLSALWIQTSNTYL